MIVFPFWLLTAFLALMLKWTLNLSAFVLALPMLYIFGCGLYTLYCREWLQFLILLVAEFGCFVLVFMQQSVLVAGLPDCEGCYGKPEIGGLLLCAQQHDFF